MKSFIYLTLTFWLLFYSCEAVFEPDTRILAKGTLQDMDGSPLPNMEVGVYSRGFSGLAGNNQTEYLLGRNTSNSDGSFQVAALFDYDDDFFIVVDGRDTRSDYVYQTNTLNYIPSDLAFDLGTVILREKALVNIYITRTSPPGTTLTYSLTYQSSRCYEVFDEGILVEEQSDCYSERNLAGELDDDRPDIHRDFESTVGSSVIFTYTIGTSSAMTETLLIDQTDFSYEFTY